MAVFPNPSSQQSPASASWLESIRAPASSAKTTTVMLFMTLSCCSSGYRQHHLLDREKSRLSASLSAFCPTCDLPKRLVRADGELWPVLHLNPRNQLIFATLGLEDRSFTLLNIEPI